MLRLNEALKSVEITGAVPPIFRRTFLHDLRLGGRFVTPGQGSFSNMRKQDRARLVIAGEPAVEVDITASQPTAFLAMTDPERLRGSGDLYELPGFPRAAVKAFFVQTFGSGRPIRKWADGTDAAARAVSVKALRTAILARFPTLAEITAILPADLKASLPAGLHDRAAGQHLVYREGRMLSLALDRVMARRVFALPLHDALVVPASGAGEAQRVLGEVFAEQFGVWPVVKVKILASIAA